MNGLKISTFKRKGNRATGGAPPRGPHTFGKVFLVERKEMI